jgi:hypothetical protein
MDQVRAWLEKMVAALKFVELVSRTPGCAADAPVDFHDAADITTRRCSVESR